MRIMKNSILWKLTLAFMLVAIITAALIAIFIRLSSAERLSQLIVDQQLSSINTALVSYYEANGSWDNVSEDWQQIQRQSNPDPSQSNDPPPVDGDPNQNNGRNRWSFFGLADANGVVIIPTNPDFPLGSVLTSEELNVGTPIEIDDKRIGTILTATTPPGFRPEENLYLQRTNQALIYTVGVALFVALILGGVLAITIIRPLQALTQAANNITRGQLEQQVKVTSNDEIGQLASAFNSMSQEVSRVNLLRKQMTADIAHDLRTPLTVIAGYIESMRDGVLQPTTERLSLIYYEIERLQNLVGDLKMLSQVDAGELPLHKQSVSPEYVLNRAVSPFQHTAEQQNIALGVAITPGLPEIMVDEARMMQIFGNLLSNAFRYTPAGGKITLSAKAEKSNVIITVEDTGSGIDSEDLPFIFDRFRRADKSRHAENGESGLGLAIVKALIEAHGGQVKAESVPEQGTTISFTIPVAV